MARVELGVHGRQPMSDKVHLYEVNGSVPATPEHRWRSNVSALVITTTVERAIELFRLGNPGEGVEVHQALRRDRTHRLIVEPGPLDGLGG